MLCGFFDLVNIVSVYNISETLFGVKSVGRKEYDIVSVKYFDYI